jgi:hypothetical protein
MCALCTRKYRNIKDLLDHDQLIHAKALNYCEYCYEAQKSRHQLFEHYKSAHLFNEQDALARATATTSSNSAGDALFAKSDINSNINVAHKPGKIISLI